MGLRLALRLYVADDSSFTRRAIAELEALRREHLDADAEVEVIDIHDDPEVAERERLLAVPALVRLSPEPVRRVVGDLSDHGAVLSALQLTDGNTRR